MKKIFYFVVAAFALLATGCNVQPTEIEENNLPDKVVVSGHVRYIAHIDKNGKIPAVKDLEVVENAEVIIFYGIKDPETGNMNYKRYPVKANEDGFFTYTFGVKPGQVIDEVKCQCTYVADDDSDIEMFGKNVEGKWIETTGILFGEVPITNLAAGSSYYYDIIIHPVTYTAEPGMEQPKDSEWGV